MRIARAEVEAFRALRRKDERKSAGLFLLEGWRSLAEAPPDAIESLAVRSDLLERPELAPFQKRGISIYTASERELAKISATEHSQGVVARARMPAGVQTPSAAGLWLALDSVADPGNLGTILRTADWFGAAGVLLGRGCVDPFNEKVVRATAGSLFRVPFRVDVDLVEALTELRGAGFEIAVSVADGGVALFKWKPSSRCAIILGSEAHGISADVLAVASVSVTIPRRGHGESLNVAIAAGILMAHFSHI